MSRCLKNCLLLSAAALLATAGYAQELPVPGTPNPDWELKHVSAPPSQNPPVQALPSSPVRMPTVPVYGGTQGQNGDWVWYYDPVRRLRYNMSKLRQGTLLVQHTETGTSYVYVRRAGSAR